MPLQRIYCPDCGSTDVQEIGSDKYRCKIQNITFRFTRPNDQHVTVNHKSVNCKRCGRPISSSNDNMCMSCKTQNLCNNCVTENNDGILMCKNCSDNDDFEPISNDSEDQEDELDPADVYVEINCHCGEGYDEDDWDGNDERVECNGCECVYKIYSENNKVKIKKVKRCDDSPKTKLSFDWDEGYVTVTDEEV